MITEELQKKINNSIKLLRVIAKRYDGVIEVAYSGGKDSDVILQLAKESGIKYHAIYKNTTIDPPGTIAHVKEMGVEIIRPKETFFEIIKRRGSPSRKARFCCEILKEYKTDYDKVIIGVRREESRNRAERYKMPTACRYFGKEIEENHVEQIYPILDWTTEDVAMFLQDRGIKCAPIYYDENGKFHPERRLGCMCCPLKSKKGRIKEFLKYPKILRLYVRNIDKYFETHQNENYENGSEIMLGQLFTRNKYDFLAQKHNLFGDFDAKKLLEEYFKIKLD